MLNWLVLLRSDEGYEVHGKLLQGNARVTADTIIKEQLDKRKAIRRSRSRPTLQRRMTSIVLASSRIDVTTLPKKGDQVNSGTVINVIIYEPDYDQDEGYEVHGNYYKENAR